jgi:nucleotide-binding universal stress UspA family protein
MKIRAIATGAVVNTYGPEITYRQWPLPADDAAHAHDLRPTRISIMTTILVPTSGSQTDAVVFAAALAVARSIRAHMEFYHVRLDPCEAALQDPHAHFCMGPAIANTLSFLEKRDQKVSTDALRHFMDFCEYNAIPILEKPALGEDVSAQWLEEKNDAKERLLLRARHSDITVLGRRHTFDYMPEGLIDALLKKSGRPIIIAPDLATSRPIRTVVVGWKETAECARALTTAMPLLTQARRVVLANVVEDRDESYVGLANLAHQLAWNGVVAEARILSDAERTVAQQLVDATRQAGADLLIVGGYGHNSFREQVFGGVTRDLVNAAELPVFLMH